MKLIIYTDGGARGNPGPAAVGVVIQQERKILAQFGKRIGKTTNNVAEYTGVIEALAWLKNNPMNPASPAGRQLTDQPIIQFFLDSNLVVNQLNGSFKIKDANLRLLLAKIRTLEQEINGEIHYTHIPREQNAQADLLVNGALDGK